MLSACLGNTVAEYIGRKHAKLDLNGANVDKLGGLMDSFGSAFRQVHRSKLPSVNVLFLNHIIRHMQGGVWISACWGIAVELLHPAKLINDVVEAPACVLWAAIQLVR